jgi:hypothetical protein
MNQTIRKHCVKGADATVTLTREHQIFSVSHLGYIHEIKYTRFPNNTGIFRAAAEDKIDCVVRCNIDTKNESLYVWNTPGMPSTIDDPAKKEFIGLFIIPAIRKVAETSNLRIFYPDLFREKLAEYVPE